MKRTIRISLLFIVHTFNGAVLAISDKAVVIVPVADLVGSPMRALMPNLSPQKAYDSLPLCGGNTNRYISCPRVHQLLFNETVEIVDQRGDEVCIKIDSFFYTTPTNKHPQHTYWTLKNNLITFKELRSHNSDLKKIPPSISFHKKNMHTNNIATLALPFTDPVTGLTFSAGTRFVQTKQGTIYALNPTTHTFNELNIPSTLLVKPSQTQQEKTKQFVNLIRTWAHTSNGFIPYGWGCTSFITTSTQEYRELHIAINDVACSYFDLPDCQQHPKTGMDCSSLIGRAAQICGIPYFFKNTLTAAQHLKQLMKTQELDEGDIIWIPGHVMVVADLGNNTILEARSCFINGQGRVQEVALNKTFQGITTYQELVEAYHKKQVLARLGMDGSVVERITDFKLLKLASVWKATEMPTNHSDQGGML